jgi:predicted metal-dependent peptidase
MENKEDELIITKSEKNRLVESWFFELLQEEPFYGKILQYINKIEDPKIHTIAIGLSRQEMCYQIFYNFDFLASLSKKARIGILLHELFHAIFNHVPFRFFGGIPHHLQNIAMDLSINGLEGLKERISGMPHVCIPGEGMFKNMPTGLLFEHYLNLLLEEQKKEPDKFNGFKTPDSHEYVIGDGNGDGEGFDSLPDDVKEQIEQIAKQRLKDVVGEVYKKTKELEQITGDTKLWGSGSAIISRILESVFKQAEASPEQILKYFLTSVRDNKKKKSWTRINRRNPMKKPSHLKTKKPQVAIAIDESGSVSDEMFTWFYGFMEQFASILEFTFIPFDDGVFEDQIYKWKKGTKHACERVLQGGTNFDAPTDYVNEHKFDGFIIMTDMCAPAPGPSKCPRLWITTENCLGDSALGVANGEKIVAIKT